MVQKLFLLAMWFLLTLPAQNSSRLQLKLDRGRLSTTIEVASQVHGSCITYMQREEISY